MPCLLAFPDWYVQQSVVKTSSLYVFVEIVVHVLFCFYNHVMHVYLSVHVYNTGQHTFYCKKITLYFSDT